MRLILILNLQVIVYVSLSFGKDINDKQNIVDAVNFFETAGFEVITYVTDSSGYVDKDSILDFGKVRCIKVIWNKDLRHIVSQMKLIIR
jgi:hypothetical protein